MEHPQGGLRQGVAVLLYCCGFRRPAVLYLHNRVTSVSRQPPLVNLQLPSVTLQPPPVTLQLPSFTIKPGPGA